MTDSVGGSQINVAGSMDGNGVVGDEAGEGDETG